MASNSFLLKGWTVVLVAALIALLARPGAIGFIVIPFLPIVIFWILDGFFLSQERLFRALYDYVRTLDEGQIDFSMDTSEYGKDPGNGWLSAMFSRTLLLFYGPIFALYALIIGLMSVVTFSLDPKLW